MWACWQWRSCLTLWRTPQSPRTTLTSIWRRPWPWPHRERLRTSLSSRKWTRRLDSYASRMIFLMLQEYPVKKTLRETSKITCIIISFTQFSLKATCISCGANVTFQVFKHSFIPRNLDEVIDFERDVILAKEGQTEGVCTYTCAHNFKLQRHWILLSLISL